MELHILKLIEGACIIVKHDNGTASMINVCAGNTIATEDYNQPVYYLLGMGLTGLARFILTCPQKKSLDGIDAIYRGVGFKNFWHSGAFVDRWETVAPEENKDYELYRDLMLGRYNGICHSIRVESGYTSPHANFDVLSPSQGLMATDNLDIVDASVVLLASSALGHKVLIAGDVGRRAYLEMSANSTIRPKMENVDVLVVGNSEGLRKSIDIVAEVIRPKIIIYEQVASRIIDDQRLSGIKQILVKEVGAIIIDDAYGAFSIYATSVKLGMKHPIYQAFKISDF